MSRHVTTGIHPETKERVIIAWGWDEVPGFKPGWFFQVFDKKSDDDCIVNEGFLSGISENRLNELASMYSAKIKI